VRAVPTVLIQPAGIELDVRDGESVAEAAWRQGYVWPTQCWGQTDCMSCFAKILDGELAARPADQEELDAIRFKMSDKMKSNPLVRLGCRIRVSGAGLVLEKQGVRPEQSADHNMLDDGAQPSRSSAARRPRPMSKEVCT
jgi:2Fe-2S ferredoxin